MLFIYVTQWQLISKSEMLRASEEFKTASENFEVASKKIEAARVGLEAERYLITSCPFPPWSRN